MNLTTSLKDRAAGAGLGSLIGDALALGPHWYYDLEELRRNYGEWITGYTDPMPGHYHEELKAGQPSQSGVITTMLLRSVVENEGYKEEDFCRRLDEDLFPLLDGTPSNGPGGYTSQSIRGAWNRRVKQGLSWKETGVGSDTTEAAERALVIAARYAKSPAKVAELVSSNCVLTQNDQAVVAMTTAYCCVISMLVMGHPLDTEISGKLIAMMRSGELPFNTMPGKAGAPSQVMDPLRPLAGSFASPDALAAASSMAGAVRDPGIVIEPAWKVSLLFGMSCAIYYQLPAAYYLGARFSDDYEEGILQSVNSGGQNQARSILTGALIGAQVGLAGIPKRFFDGLENSEELVALALELGEQAERGG